MRRRTLTAALCLALITSAVSTLAAHADDTVTATTSSASTSTVATPATSDDAKTAWIAAAQGAEQLNEALLGAQQNVLTAQAQAAAAQATAEGLQAGVTAAQAQVATADAAVAVYQPKLDAFANASLRGARLSQISTLLTADSPEDYLDQTAALNQVASETLETMSAAREAKAVADAAEAAAVDVAQQAANAAAAAVLTAQQAADAVAAQQQAMSAQILVYEQLYSSLSVAERGEAVEAFENANLSPEAEQRLAEQVAQRQEAGITDADLATNISALSVKDAPDVVSGIAVAAALTRRGLPYVWGAVGPDSFDCSDALGLAAGRHHAAPDQRRSGHASRGAAGRAAAGRPGHLLLTGDARRDVHRQRPRRACLDARRPDQRGAAGQGRAEPDRAPGTALTSAVAG